MDPSKRSLLRFGFNLAKRETLRPAVGIHNLFSNPEEFPDYELLRGQGSFNPQFLKVSDTESKYRTSLSDTQTLIGFFLSKIVPDIETEYDFVIPSPRYPGWIAYQKGSQRELARAIVYHNSQGERVCFAFDIAQSCFMPKKRGEFLVTIHDVGLNGLRSGEKDIFHERNLDTKEVYHEDFSKLKNPSPEQVRNMLELNNQYLTFLQLIDSYGAFKRRGTKVRLLQEERI